MGIFGRKKAGGGSEASPASASEAVILPEPRVVTTRAEADALLEETGDLQRTFMEGRISAEGLGEEIVARVEGNIIFFLGDGADPVKVFDVLVDSISEWAMTNFTFLSAPDLDPQSAEGRARTRAFELVCALRDKYQHLNPDNV